MERTYFLKTSRPIYSSALWVVRITVPRRGSGTMGKMRLCEHRMRNPTLHGNRPGLNGRAEKVVLD
jgi:hypothetical protein